MEKNELESRPFPNTWKMIVSNPRMIFEGFSKISSFRFTKISSFMFFLWRKVRPLFLPRITDVRIFGLDILESFGLRKLDILVSISKIKIAKLNKKILFLIDP
jgi:hypothetical protein